MKKHPVPAALSSLSTSLIAGPSPLSPFAADGPMLPDPARRRWLRGGLGGAATAMLGGLGLVGCGGGGGDAGSGAPGEDAAQATATPEAEGFTVVANLRAAITDAAPQLQSLLDQVRATGRRSTSIKVESDGVITLNAGIVIDPYFHDVDFMGAVVNYTPTTGVAITVMGTVGNAFTQLVGGVSNINLRGPSTGTACGILIRGQGVSSRSSSVNRNVTTSGFDIAIDFGDYAYLTHFHNLVIDAFGSIGLRQGAGADAAENITLFGGCISNGRGTAIVAEDDTAELLLYGVSLDYNARVLDIRGAGGNIELHGGHIEYQGGEALPDQVRVYGNGSNFKMIGGYWVVNTNLGNGPYAYPNVVNVVSPNSIVMLDKVRLVNHRNTADTWAVGEGRVITKDCVLFENSLMPYVIHAKSSEMRDGSFERNAIADFWYVARDQAGGYSSRYNGGVMSLSLDGGVARTGQRSLRMQRGVVGAGFGQVGGLAIPVDHLHNQHVAANCFARSDTGVPTQVSFYWGALRALDVNQRPVWDTLNTYAARFFNGTIGANGWTQIGITNSAVVPPWATHLVLEFDISAGAPSTSLWIDDVTFNAW